MLNDDVYAAIARTKHEVIEDVKAGIVPSTVTSFSQLHDYVDANVYGGLCDDEDGREEFSADFANSVQDRVDRWLKSGGLLKALDGGQRFLSLDYRITVRKTDTGGWVLAQDDTHLKFVWADHHARGVQVWLEQRVDDGFSLNEEGLVAKSRAFHSAHPETRERGAQLSMDELFDLDWDDEEPAGLLAVDPDQG